MKTIFKFLAVNALSMVCVTCACVMACNDRGGWGWLLGLGLMTAHTFNSKDFKDA